MLWSLGDHIGSIRDVVRYNPATNTTQVANHLFYDAFGNIVSESDVNLEHRFAFTGREWDEEIDLQYNRARYYDPQMGRWISKDPLGFDAGDMNLYRYVGNGPTDAVDPSGLEEPRQLKIGPSLSCAVCHGGRGFENVAAFGQRATAKEQQAALDLIASGGDDRWFKPVLFMMEYLANPNDEEGEFLRSMNSEIDYSSMSSAAGTSMARGTGRFGHSIYSGLYNIPAALVDTVGISLEAFDEYRGLDPTPWEPFSVYGHDEGGTLIEKSGSRLLDYGKGISTWQHWENQYNYAVDPSAANERALQEGSASLLILNGVRSALKGRQVGSSRTVKPKSSKPNNEAPISISESGPSSISVGESLALQDARAMQGNSVHDVYAGAGSRGVRVIGENRLPLLTQRFTPRQFSASELQAKVLADFLQRSKGMSKNQIQEILGPAVSIGQDSVTGQLSSIYYNQVSTPPNLQSPIASKISTAPQLWDLKPGLHVEVWAANELLTARPGMPISDVRIFTMETQVTKYRFQSKPPCTQCNHLLEGATLLEYGKSK